MEEERWIRVLRWLNVLPLVVCFLMLVIMLGLGYRSDIWLVSILLLCVIAYFLLYFIRIKERRNIKMLWVLVLNLISTTFWLVVFSLFSAEMITSFTVGVMVLSVFVVGYPLWMLYYNFRLFMNEISKPTWHADDADVPSQIVTDFCL